MKFDLLYATNPWVDMFNQLLIFISFLKFQPRF